MAGNTKCYRVVRLEDGSLEHSVVERSPKYADSVKEAVAKLTSNPPQPATVKFHDYLAVAAAINTSRPTPT